MGKMEGVRQMAGADKLFREKLERFLCSLGINFDHLHLLTSLILGKPVNSDDDLSKLSQEDQEKIIAELKKGQEHILRLIQQAFFIQQAL